MFALAVALLTWFGVFGYLLRLDLLTRSLEKRLSRDEEAQL
jgi:CcmD family protein